MKKILSAILIAGTLTFISPLGVTAGVNVNMSEEEYCEVSVDEINEKLLQELDIDSEQIEMVQVIQGKSNDEPVAYTMGENDELISDSEMGFLQISLYENAMGEKEIISYVFIDEEGAPLSANDIITGTGCSFATKSKTVSSGIVKGTTYSSTGNYYPTTKALRIYSDGYHKNASMYLEYTLNGTKYTGEYDIKNI